MAGQWRDVATFYEGRGAKYGTLSIVSILVFAAILVAVNYLASRQNKRWDLTSNQVYSLSDQTVKILQTLDAPVKFTVFDQETSLDMHRDRLEAYTYLSPKVTAEFIDPVKNPLRAKAAEITALGTALVEYKDRTERVTTIDEQNLTNALIKAVTGETRKVYFTQGHGEKDTSSSDRTGYSAIAQALGTRQLRRRTAAAGADARSARRRHRAGGRGAADRLPAARGRRDGQVPGPRRQGAGDDRSAGRPGRLGHAAPRRILQGVGLQHRRRHRRRCERHRSAARHRRLGAGGR